MNEYTIIALDAPPLIHRLHWKQKDPPSTQEFFLRRIEYIRDHIQRMTSTEIWCFACFDNDKPTFRHKLSEEYKKDREKDYTIKEALSMCRMALTTSSHWNAVDAPDGFETDDILASIASQSQGKVVLVTPDKDLYQCLEKGKVNILKDHDYDPFTDGLKCTWFSWDSFVEEYGFTPDRWIDYQCIVGDSVDSVVGAKGIGPKLATQYIKTVGRPFDEWWFPGMKLTAKKTESLFDLRERIDTVRNLVTMRTDLTVETSE